MGGQVPPRKLLENPAPEPHDHLNIKHRLTYKFKRLSGHADSHYKDSPSGCQFYRSPFAGEPKKCLLSVTYPPIYQHYSNYSMSTTRYIRVFT